MKFFAWLQHWVRTAVAASSRKEFYRRLEERKVGEGIAHLALLSLFLLVLPFIVYFFVDAGRASNIFTENLRSRIPAGTVFEMKDGKFTDTLAEPVVFGDKNFVVRINSATSSLTLAEGENGLLVTSTGITQQDGPKTQTVSFKDAPNFRVTREEILDGIARWMPVVLFVGAIFVSIMMFGITLFGFLFSAAAHALLLFLALKVAKRPWPWKRAFVASAYASTLPIVLNAFVTASGIRLGFLPSLLYWLILIWIAYDVITRSAAPGKGAHDGSETNAVDRPAGGQ